MTKLDQIPPSLAYPTPSLFDRGPASRLIVLLPTWAGESPGLSHRIWEIARSEGLNVLLLGLYTDAMEELQLRRRLITMAASIKDTNISAEFMMECGDHWLGKVKDLYRPGDVVACYAAQRVGLRRRPLHDVLRSELEAPIYILSADQPIRNQRSSWYLQAAFWLGSLIIIGGFFWLEAKLVKLPQDWAHSSLLYIAVLIEIGVIWVWNSIFTQSP